MIVWYGVEDNSLAEPPESLLQYLMKKDPRFLKAAEKQKAESNFTKCPAIIDSLKNTYIFKATYDFDFMVDHEGVHAEHDDEEIVRHILMNRDKEILLTSIQDPKFWMIAEDDSLIAEQLPPIHSPHMMQNTMYMQGQYDIGKHFRPLECAFMPNKAGQKYSFKRGDHLYYVRFHTDEKIKFKRFRFNTGIYDLGHQIFRVKHSTMRIMPLKEIYGIIRRTKMKNSLMKLIKQNSMED
jgi:hypothetical protein